MLHPDYLDTASGPIGRVVTSEEHPATAHEFYSGRPRPMRPRAWTSGTSSPPSPRTPPPSRSSTTRAATRTCSPSSTTSTPSTATRLCRPSQRG